MAETQPSAIDCAYAAGIIDGEGSIVISELPTNGRDRKTPLFVSSVQVVMCNEEIPRWLMERFGGNVHPYKARQPHHKDAFQWKVTSRRAVRVCELVRPYLRLKHRHADVLCGLYSDSRIMFGKGGGKMISPEEVAARHEYAVAMRHLNSRGRGKGVAAWQSS